MNPLKKAVKAIGAVPMAGKAVKSIAPKAMYKNRTPKQMIGAVKKKIKGY